ncbi:MAG: CAP domain-containing protein [Myxococcaceae bacterium]|nr:CAP domain-containing protein [Myxococcaceae bacterium]
MTPARFVLALLVSGCMGIAEGSIDEPLVTAGGGAAPQVMAGGGAGGGQGGGGAVVTVDAGGGAAVPVDAGVPDAGPVDPCSTVRCSANARCRTMPVRCECDPGFVGDGGACLPGDPGVPALRTEAQVCTAFAEGMRSRVTGMDFVAGASMCDVGTLTRAAIDDALARLNFYRWLSGLGPVRDDAQQNAAAQACSVVSAWNPAGPQAHFPMPGATCYSQLGAGGAGSSNIAWGSANAADAIDQWMIDWGNETTFGHRRWFLYPSLDGVGIGFYRGGNQYGSASCSAIFGSGNPGPSPMWFSFPPAGFSPVSVTQWTWSVHGDIPQQGATATVTRVGDGMALPVRVDVMQGGYGRLSAVTLVRMGWNPVAGQRYRVVLDGPQGPRREWEVAPVTCP